VLNLSLTDNLCGALPPPLGTIFCNLPGSANSKQSATKTPATHKSSPLSPMLVGAGK
jgi:hypothetical protein